MLYLFVIDVLYMMTTVTVLPPLILLRIIGVCDKVEWFDKAIEGIMQKLFRMNRMDVLGFRR